MTNCKRYHNMEYKLFLVFDYKTIELYTCTNSRGQNFQSSTKSQNLDALKDLESSIESLCSKGRLLF